MRVCARTNKYVHFITYSTLPIHFSGHSTHVVIYILASNTLTNLNHQTPEEALNTFMTILRTNPASPRARYGKAQALDQVAEKKHSNSLLQEAIDAYEHVLALGASVPDKLFVQAAERCINRMRFKGENEITLLTNINCKSVPDRYSQMVGTWLEIT